ncbi:hypothetical protein BGZ65_012245 [Modicella reniformis]|uniref:SURP motif domain-containing protein n=1 Tax=Modicella reniformis TaxID=1440133 RepID=A0A9P6J8T4_9FUNG|nr:hypothetical protein BGZ65_012245 [Modicella reniformis]
MWNDPDLGTHRDSPRYETKNSRMKDRKQEELSAFGYESFLFHNDGVAEAIEQGQLLITWQGQDPADESALWLDRYDVRNLLDDQRLFSGTREIQGDNFQQETSDFDAERFKDLDSDEEYLFEMDEDEREEHLAQKRQENDPSRYKGIQYDYGAGNEQAQEPTFRLHFEVPEGMSVPDSEKALALIERTAKFVNNSSEPTMEIILQAKQATNPNFAFLSRRHHLHPFYKHVRWLLQTGLYETAEDVRQREAEEARTEQEEETRRAAEVAEAQKAVFHPDIEKIIEKTIEFLNARDDCTMLEVKLLSLNDSKFQFMKPGHAWNEYYIKKRRSAKETRAWDEGMIETDPTDLFLTHLEHEEQLPSKTNISRDGGQLQPDLSSKEARATEMRRLDRLQRVKELLQQKREKKADYSDVPTGANPGHESK